MADHKEKHLTVLFKENADPDVIANNVAYIKELKGVTNLDVVEHNAVVLTVAGEEAAPGLQELINTLDGVEQAYEPPPRYLA